MQTCKEEIKRLFTEVQDHTPLDKTDVYLYLKSNFSKPYISTILRELTEEGFLIMSGINASGCNTYKLRSTSGSLMRTVKTTDGRKRG